MTEIYCIQIIMSTICCIMKCKCGIFAIGTRSVANDFSQKAPCKEQGALDRRYVAGLFPLDGVGSAVPSLQLHPVFGIDTERVPPNDAMSRFVGFGDKSWDNLKNFFQTQGFEFLFLSQSARRVAFGGSMAPKTPVLKLNRPFARKPPAAIASELTRVACAPFAKPQVAGLRHS